MSSATEDADLFLVVRAFSPDMKELVFQGALDPHTPLAQGWLRVSHRKLDKKLTLPYRPYHTHDEEQKLKKGEIVESTSRSGRPASWCRRATAWRYGARQGLRLSGRRLGRAENARHAWTGVGPFQHNDPRDRPAAVFGGDVTLHTGPGRNAYLLLPIIPGK